MVLEMLMILELLERLKPVHLLVAMKASKFYWCTAVFMWIGIFQASGMWKFRAAQNAIKIQLLLQCKESIHCACWKTLLNPKKIGVISSCIDGD